MAYFLKKTNRKNGLYLQIYESFYNSEKKETSHKCFQNLGNINNLISVDIPDPISYFKIYVDELNQKRKTELEVDKIKKICDSPEKHLGYFLAQSIFNKLDFKQHFDLFQSNKHFDFSIYELFTSLVYARLVQPCSKLKTFHDVLPKLFEPISFSSNQMYDGISFIGNDYEKIIEIINASLFKVYSIVTDITYFDCTNFYFEIDRQDSFRKKGPSKENRKEPLVGLGLLLDANQIPIGMKLFPGNESEKPVIRDVISNLKSRHNISGKTIQVADKGLNCAKNIYYAMKGKDGYLFSKSVKQLPEKEKKWVLLNNDYVDILDEKGKAKYKMKSCIEHFNYFFDDDDGVKRKFKVREKRVVTYNYDLAKKQKIEIRKMADKAKALNASKAKRAEYGESCKYVVFNSTNNQGEVTDDKVAISMNEQAVNKDLELAGYNLLVTSEHVMKDSDVYGTYHNLWKIEESFRIMKTQLEARPVYLQKEESIKGHFLICYVSVLLLRLMQYKLFKNQICTNKLVEFIRDYRVIKLPNKDYINITTHSKTIELMCVQLKLPIDNYFLTKKQIRKVLNFKL